MVPWLALAAAVHALIWAAWRGEARSALVVQLPDAVANIEVEILPPEATQSKATQSEALRQVASEPEGSVEPSATEGRAFARGAASTPTEQRTNAPSSVPPLADVDATHEAGAAMIDGAPTAESEARDVADGDDAHPRVASAQTSKTSTDALPSSIASAAAAPSVTPSDRLAALGYGVPNAAALRPYLNVSPAAIAEDRLNQHLAQATVDQDRDHSLGIEGPITNAVHTAAMSVVVPKSLSKVAITIGRDGKLADFRIIETNRDARALKALGERVKRLLANQTVRVPSGRAMEFIYEVKSEVLLPSGHAPGLAVEVLGIPVKKGRDEKSSKISILTPHIAFKSQSQADPERNGKVTQTLPQLVYGISVLGLNADAVDIGAPERQVVHTRLVQQRVL
jgi:hypothetical protein